MPMPHAAGWAPATSSAAVLRAEVLMSVSFGRGLGGSRFRCWMRTLLLHRWARKCMWRVVFPIFSLRCQLGTLRLPAGVIALTGIPTKLLAGRTPAWPRCATSGAGIDEAAWPGDAVINSRERASAGPGSKDSRSSHRNRNLRLGAKRDGCRVGGEGRG
jgi:hypothetical protein